MSDGWQPYLDALLQDEQVRSAGLYGQDGTVWAATDDLRLPATEVRDLVAGTRDTALFLESGVVIAGAKYRFIHVYSDADNPMLTGFFAKKDLAFAIGVVTGKALLVLLAADGVTAPTEIQSYHPIVERLVASGF